MADIGPMNNTKKCNPTLIISILLLILSLSLKAAIVLAQTPTPVGIVQDFKNTYFNDSEISITDSSGGFKNESYVNADGGSIIFADFTDVGLLKQHSSVKVAGVPIGSVQDISLIKSGVVARVKLLINKDQSIFQDDVLSVRTIVGTSDTFIKVSRGSMSQTLKSGAIVVDTESAIDFVDIVGKFVHSCKGRDDADCLSKLLKCGFEEK